MTRMRFNSLPGDTFARLAGVKALIDYADNSIGAMEQRAQEGLKALAEDEGWDFGDYSAEKHTLDAEGALEPQSAPWTKGRKRDSSHDDKQR